MTSTAAIARLGLLGAWLAAAAAVGYIIAGTDYDVQGALIIGPALVILALVLLPRMAGRGQQLVLAALMAGLLAKLVASLIRLYVSFDLYDRVADALGYHGTGQELAQHLRGGNVQALVPYLDWGTDAVKAITGLLYAVMGPSLVAAYLVYGFLAFLGSYFFYRAFSVTFPPGGHRLYAVLVFLYPSIVYWPNGLGKDALMFFASGLTAYGGALMLQRIGPRAVALTLAGLLTALVVRPHIAGMLALALALPLALRSIRGTITAPLAYSGGLGVSVVLAWFFVPRALDFVGLEGLDLQATLSFLELRQLQTLQGGSAFTPPPLDSPLHLGPAVVSVLFRPFPWEAHNLQALAQALEGMALMALVAWRAPSVLRCVASVRSYPFVLFILVLIFMLIIALTSIGNFGILARQRAQLLPLLMMLLAFTPAARPRRADSEGGPWATCWTQASSSSP